MIDTEARRRTVEALERIARALERANDADPLLAIQKALEAEKPGDLGNGANPPVFDPNADMPPHIRRALGVE